MMSESSFLPSSGLRWKALANGWLRSRPTNCATCCASAALAPGTWARPNPANPALPWVANTAYQQLNGVALALRVEPDGPADEPHSATLPLGDLKALPFFRHPEVTTYIHYDARRPAAQRANALKTRYSFKTEVDEDARRHLFPQNAQLAG